MENPKILLQSKIYLFLLQNGLAPAKVIAQKVGLGRALAYKILKQLIALELVEEKHNIGKITFFTPLHPKRLGDLLSEKMGKLSQANTLFKSTLGELSSEYNLLMGKPNVQFHEGVGGLQNLHNDILDAGKDIFIISSPVEEGKHEILHLIR
ncbi:MAG: hypothetical protein HYV68_02465, partial [Candidatus Taylorbacteria bacterium]|nr:hypothetical protein [Candidatus Taylorbacteria bacterium]